VPQLLHTTTRSKSESADFKGKQRQNSNLQQHLVNQNQLIVQEKSATTHKRNNKKAESADGRCNSLIRQNNAIQDQLIVRAPRQHPYVHKHLGAIS